MASALALRAKVRTPSRHLFPPDFCAADVAGLPGPAEDLHLQLMPAFAPTRIEIVAEARAAVAQGKLLPRGGAARSYAGERPTTAHRPLGTEGTCRGARYPRCAARRFAGRTRPVEGAE